VIRGDATRPQAALPTRTTSHYGAYSYGGYRPKSYYHRPYYGYWGHSYWSPWYYHGFSFSIGFGFYRPYYVYYGTHSIAFLGVRAWHIVPYYHGWCGYYFGPRYYYFPRYRARPHVYYYHGVYCRVSRPYWYGYTRWYDWRPYRYGYYSLAYDSIYEEGYEHGYTRGYEDGAEDSSAYRDDRRRDRVASVPRPRVPDAAQERQRGEASAEFRHEMQRGSEAFATGNYRVATDAFKEAVILNPSDAEARYSLAMSAFAEGKYAFSAFALRRAITQDPESSNIDVEAAFGGPARFAEYLRPLDRELEVHSSDPDLLLLRGFMSLRIGDYRTAARTLDLALQHLPRDQATRTLHEEAVNALADE
jgi:tetratricopeptide (TPR) repeat protein